MDQAQYAPEERIDDIHQNPWVGLVYLFFVFFPLLFWDAPTSALWVSLAATAVFIPMHFIAARSAPTRRTVLALAMVGLAYVVVPFNPGGHTFLLYALATLAWTVRPRACVALGALFWLVMAVQMVWVYPFKAIAVGTAGLSVVLGSILVASIIVERARMRRDAELRLSQDEVRKLARLAERERISRDLHDLLGHTLSLVALKSELAGKLLERDPVRAREHMAEVERVARQALAEVREAVSGMRSPELQAELAAARLALESTGVQVHVRFDELALAPPQEQVLAMALREGVTNVIRHSQAERVDITLARSETGTVLEIQDNGRGMGGSEGNGLTGMRERLVQLGGWLELESPPGAGTRLSLHLPTQPPATSSAQEAAA